MPNKLLIVFYDLGLGGVQTKMIDIINYFGKRYPSITVHLLLRTRSAFDRREHIHNKRLIIHTYATDVPYIRGPFFFTLYVLYKSFIIHPQSMLSFLSPFSLPVLLTKILFFWRKSTIIVNEDNFTSGIIHTYKHSLLNKLGIKLFYPLADAVIVPTGAVQRDLMDSYHIPRSKLVCIRNWTSLRPSRSRSFSKKYDLLYAGRLDKTKRVGMLLTAVRTLRKSYRSVRLLIIGHGNEEQSLKTYVNANKLNTTVTFQDTTPNIRHIFEQAKIFTFSTQKRGEGFPFAVLEAMAMGLPVLSYKFAGVEDTIIDGINGYTYSTEREFITKCTQLLANPRLCQKLSQQAKITVQTNHSASNIHGYATLLGYR